MLSHLPYDLRIAPTMTLTLRLLNLNAYTRKVYFVVNNLYHLILQIKANTWKTLTQKGDHFLR